MKNASYLYVIIGLLVGSLATYVITTYQIKTLTSHMTETVRGEKGMLGSHASNMTMSEMTTVLQDTRGDIFDKVFLEMMIDHHQGAVDMANLAKTNAKHIEIKQMAEEIISSQSKEIEQMNQWYLLWDY